MHVMADRSGEELVGKIEALPGPVQKRILACCMNLLANGPQHLDYFGKLKDTRGLYELKYHEHRLIFFRDPRDAGNQIKQVFIYTHYFTKQRQRDHHQIEVASQLRDRHVQRLLKGRKT